MFYFSLQSVLNYRKQIEEKLMLDFADTKRRLYCEKELLEKMKKERADLISCVKRMGENQMRSSDAANYFSYINFIKDAENNQEEVVSKVEKELEEKRIELISASRKRKVLEIIKEKELKEYRQSLIIREQKELDEIGILRVRV